MSDVSASPQQSDASGYSGPATALITSIRQRGLEPLAGVAVAAVGIVFGDIGTSPLYTMRSVLTAHSEIGIDATAIMGVISMIIWCLIIIVTCTYIGLILRADNQGEGGILSLAALIKRKLGSRTKVSTAAIVIAVIGAALFLGDSLITPAISVLSAAEGLTVVSSDLSTWVIPVSVAVLTVLFVVQKRGTARIGRAFGPVMVAWFVVIAVLGVPHIAARPEILAAFSPTYAVSFALERPWAAFLALGGCVLAVTGAEALYSDLGHFGRKPIALGWLALVFPALVLNYLGQGGLLLENPAALSSPFYELAPAWSRVPLVILATLATIIASQAVVTGAFSLVHQATRLSLLPRIQVVHTSDTSSGQIYIPAINHILFVGVLLMVLVSGASERLASAYGLAVAGTLLLSQTLFIVFARRVWKWSLGALIPLGVIAGGLEVFLFVANTIKIPSGGWIPLVIAIAIVAIMLTWQRGSRIAFGYRRDLEGPLEPFVRSIFAKGVHRVPGVAVYPHGNPETTPLALRATINFAHTLHEHVVIVCVKNLGVPHVPHEDRVVVNPLGDEYDGVVQVLYRVGFLDSQDVPKAVLQAVGLSRELDFTSDDVTYVLSVFRIEISDDLTGARWPRWQRSLFRWLERFSANRTQVFHLPPERTVVMGAEVKI